MNEWITDLLALQDLDMKIRNLKLRISTIPSEKARLDSLVKEGIISERSAAGLKLYFE